MTCKENGQKSKNPCFAGYDLVMTKPLSSKEAILNTLKHFRSEVQYGELFPYMENCLNFSSRFIKNNMAHLAMLCMAHLAMLWDINEFFKNIFIM